MAQKYTWNLCTRDLVFGSDLSLCMPLSSLLNIEPCGDGEFRCPGDMFGPCYPDQYRCDLFRDCFDGYDESDCEGGM